MEVPLGAWFISTIHIKPAKIHYKLIEVWFKHVYRNVCKWCREFAAHRTEIHEERNWSQSIFDGSAMKFEQSMCEDLWITLDDFCTLVPEVSRSFIGFWQKSCNIGRYVLTGKWSLLWIFSYYEVKKDNFWDLLSWVTKTGHSTSHLRPNNHMR